MVDSVPHAGVDEPGFAVSVQRVHLDIDFKQRKLRGRTDMIIQPLSKDLRTLKFNCRQCKIRRALVQGKSVGAVYHDPYQKLVTHLSMGVHQHHLLSKRIEGSLKNPPNEELVIQLPKSVRIEELDPLTANANDLAMPAYLDFLTMRQEGEDAKNVTDLPAGKLEADKTYYKPITVTIEYEVQDPRDGFHFVGTDEGDRRYPHAYSNASEIVPSACNIMPCRDHPLARSAWEVSVRCPRTVADVYAQGSTSSSKVHYRSWVSLGF